MQARQSSHIRWLSAITGFGGLIEILVPQDMIANSIKVLHISSHFDADPCPYDMAETLPTYLYPQALFAVTLVTTGEATAYQGKDNSIDNYIF